MKYHLTLSLYVDTCTEVATDVAVEAALARRV